MADGLPLYENGNFFVMAAEFGTGRFKPKSKGFEVYESGVTCARRVSQIGFDGAEGLARAKAECDRRANIHKGEKS